MSASVASTSGRSMSPSPNGRCSWCVAGMSSSCTLLRYGAAARSAPSTPPGSTTRQCPTSTVMPSSGGAPRSPRSRSASSTVSTSMPGSGSSDSRTRRSPASSTSSPTRSRSRAQPSAALASSGRMPEKNETHRASRSAAISTARSRYRMRSVASRSTSVGRCLCNGSSRYLVPVSTTVAAPVPPRIRRRWARRAVTSSPARGANGSRCGKPSVTATASYPTSSSTSRATRSGWSPKPFVP